MAVSCINATQTRLTHSILNTDGGAEANVPRPWRRAGCRSRFEAWTEKAVIRGDACNNLDDESSALTISQRACYVRRQTFPDKITTIMDAIY